MTLRWCGVLTIHKSTKSLAIFEKGLRTIFRQYNLILCICLWDSFTKWPLKYRGQGQEFEDY